MWKKFIPEWKQRKHQLWDNKEQLKPNYQRLPQKQIYEKIILNLSNYRQKVFYTSLAIKTQQSLKIFAKDFCFLFKAETENLSYWNITIVMYLFTK